MKPLSYFEKRQAANIWHTYNDTEKYQKELIEIYRQANDEVLKELYKLGELAERDGWLTRSEFYRAQHLKRLSGEYEKVLQGLGENVQSKGQDVVLKAGKAIYEATGKELGIPINYNKKAMIRLLQSPWKGATFSERIWKNQGKLHTALMDKVRHGMATGKNVTQIALDLNKEMGTGLYNASRLVRTETMHHLNDANLVAMKERGVKKVREVVTIDDRTSEECAPHEGLIHDIDKAPTLPRHPHCRCVLVAVIDAKELAKRFDEMENEGYNKYSRIDTGASGAKNYFRDNEFDYLKDPEDVRREVHAYTEYDRIKNSDQEHQINKIYKNIKKLEGMEDFTRDDVEIAFNHVFNDIHSLEDGKGLFKPDYDMAQSWNRLINTSNIQEHDLALLRHERLEHEYMYTDGLDYGQAHDKATGVYSYNPPKKEK